MTTEVQATEQSTQAPVVKTVSDPNLSFTEYETLRRGGTLPVSESTSDTSAPAPETGKEQKEVAASETAKPEEKKSDGVETETDGESSSGEEELEATGKPDKKKGGFQKRIDRLNRDKAAQFERAERAEAELARLRAGEAKPETKVDTKPAAPDAGKPDPDKFATHAEWVEAVADWKADQKVEQKLKERDQKAERSKIESEQAEKAKSYGERLKEFSKKTPDFEEVEANVTEALEEAGMRVSPVLGSIFLNKANGPELAYELAKDPKEFIRVNKLAPLDAAIEIGNLQARIASRTSAAQVTETKKTTQAPKPIEPVGGGKAAAAKKSPEQMSYSEYEQYRRDQQKRRGA